MRRVDDPRREIARQAIFHSHDTRVYQLATPIAAGATELLIAEVLLAQAHEILEKMGAADAKNLFAAYRWQTRSSFTTTASRHFGQELTLIHKHTFFFHQGMVVSGVYHAARERLNLDAISAASGSGPSTNVGFCDGSELDDRRGFHGVTPSPSQVPRFSRKLQLLP
jgi:NAD(P)H dehydrogenase (quinone)